PSWLQPKTVKHLDRVGLLAASITKSAELRLSPVLSPPPAATRYDGLRRQGMKRRAIRAIHSDTL
ncbi:MAG: hypothetical protein ABJA69_12525, partial [Acidobacteriaceae bacterium]